MNGKLSIIISVILVTTAILTVQSSSSSMLQPSYAQLCPDGSTPDASGNCATMPPPATDGETLPPQATETPPPVAPPAVASQGSNNTGGMSADWANSILAVHNSERAAVGVPPLVWSDTLAASAQAWAEHLATMKEMVHSGPGENIAGFNWEDGPTAPYGASLWVAEKQNWRGGVLTEENWYPTGHYTQMVWRNTQEVGCGAAPPGAGGPTWSTLVCQYNPPGNYMGQAPY
jgi:pathogenesis-related protein 1